MTQTTLMSIPGQIDPVPVARDITPREDGRAVAAGAVGRRAPRRVARARRVAVAEVAAALEQSEQRGPEHERDND